jgi:hypothetical protein
MAVRILVGDAIERLRWRQHPQTCPKADTPISSP